MVHIKSPGSLRLGGTQKDKKALGIEKSIHKFKERLVKLNIIHLQMVHLPF